MQLHGSSGQGQTAVFANPFVLLSPPRGRFSPASPRQRGWGGRAGAQPGEDSQEPL